MRIKVEIKSWNLTRDMAKVFTLGNEIDNKIHGHSVSINAIVTLARDNGDAINIVEGIFKMKTSKTIDETFNDEEAIKLIEDMIYPKVVIANE